MVMSIAPLSRRRNRLRNLVMILSPATTAGFQLGLTAPDVQDESLVAAMVAHSFMAFSASPHCHWAAVLMLPPPTRLSTHIPRSWPVTESVIFASPSAPPMNGYVPVARYLSELKRRAWGIAMEIVRSTGVADSASTRATWSRI